MNPAIANQMNAVSHDMAKHGESQPGNPPPEGDGRGATSPANGKKGGRPAIDYGKLADAYLAHNETRVQWRKGEFFEYDRKRGAYVRLTEKEMGVRVGGFLRSGGGGEITYSANAERNVVGALRANGGDILRQPPFFLSTGKRAPGWVAMRNGLLDIESAARGEAGALHPHTDDFFSTYALPYDWQPDAPCPRFMRFLEEVQPEADGREMLQLLAGLLTVPDTSRNVFFLLLGEGGCGKSTFVKILGAMLGPDNVCSVPLSMFVEKHTTHRLTRALANLVEDSPTVEGRGLTLSGVEGVLKQVTDGGLLHVEPKGVDPWEAPATARCVFCMNPPPPRFVDRSAAIWDRLRLVPFPVRIRGTEAQNPRLAEEIVEAELPGVFAWAVAGLGKLRPLKQFPQCEAGRAIIAEHRESCDPERLFLQDRYRVVPGAFTPSNEIYPAYVGWCSGEGNSHKASKTFSHDVRRVFPSVEMGTRYVDGKKARGYVNLARLPDEGETEGEVEIPF